MFIHDWPQSVTISIKNGIEKMLPEKSHIFTCENTEDFNIVNVVNLRSVAGISIRNRVNVG